MGTRPDSRRVERDIIAAISERLGKGRRGPKPFGQAARVWEWVRGFKDRLMRGVASELDASFPLRVAMWVKVSYRRERGGVSVVTLTTYGARPERSSLRAGLLMGSRKVVYPGSVVDISGGRIPWMMMVETVVGDWRLAFWPSVLVGLLGGAPHDEEYTEYMMARWGGALRRQGFEPRGADLAEMVADHVMEGGCPDLCEDRELVRMYGRARRRNGFRGEEYDSERTGSDVALGWAEQWAGDEKEPAKGLSVADVYQARTRGEHEAVRIAERGESLGFGYYGGRGQSLSRYVRRTQGKRADAILRRLSRCTRRHRKGSS